MSSLSLILSLFNICLDFPTQLRKIAEKNAQAMRDVQEAKRGTDKLMRELKKEREKVSAVHTPTTWQHRISRLAHTRPLLLLAVIAHSVSAGRGEAL